MGRDKTEKRKKSNERRGEVEVLKNVRKWVQHKMLHYIANSISTKLSKNELITNI